MTDLVQAFYERDLSAAEMDELEQLLEASPAEAQRFHRLAEAQGQAWGLKAPRLEKARPRKSWVFSWRLAWLPALALTLGLWLLWQPGPPQPWTDTVDTGAQGLLRGAKSLREEGYENFPGQVKGVQFERWDLYRGEARVGRRYRVHNSRPGSVKVKIKILRQSHAVDRFKAPDLPDGWISVGPYRRVELGGMDAASAGQAWSFEVEIFDQAMPGAAR